VSNISLIAFAKYYNVNSIMGLAQKARKTSPPISVRSLLHILGLPLQPTNLSLVFAGLDGTFSWQDPAASSPIQATNWQWQLNEQVSNVVVAKRTVQTPSVTYGFPTSVRSYQYQVVPANGYGLGPSSSWQYFTAGQPGPSGPTITAIIASDDKVTVSGKHFNKSQTVNIQATVTGSASTPNLANNVPDLRNQYSQVTADANGSFTNAVISPQPFQQVMFANGDQAYVLAGEHIAVIAKNNNVGSYSPGPGVSNVVTMPAPTTVS
jgi:hypothetical protein